jgi:hypothetical protein
MMASPYKQNVHGRVAAFQQQPSAPASSSSSSAAAFHGLLQMQQIQGHDSSYGRPAEGTKTEYRGKMAGVRISNEIIELCDIIKTIGQPGTQPGTHVVTFGVLFEFYTKVSNKLVGMLLRARKQGLVAFEGEMLFQRRDDHVIITLLKEPSELEQDMEQRRQELSQHASLHK